MPFPPAHAYRVFVCNGVHCTTFLADDVYRAWRDEVRAARIGDRVSLARSGCFSRCGGGVTVVVRRETAAGARLDPIDADPFALRPEGRVLGGDSLAADDVVYPEVCATDVARVVREHLIEGQPVHEWRVGKRGSKSAPAPNGGEGARG